MAGVLVTAGMMGALALILRPAGDSPPREGAPGRGGEIVAAIRGTPPTFNPLAAADEAADEATAAANAVLHAPLVRVNRATFDLEPWLAERWESSADGLTHTLHLREGLTWSDGAALTSADVLFSARALYDPDVRSALASRIRAGGQPLRFAAPDPRTVVVTFPAPSGPGLRLLDELPILPRHRLEAALAAGTLAGAWTAATPPADVTSAGPFVLREYQDGQRVVLDRNPRYWRTDPDGTRLPYLDRIVLRVVPGPDAELHSIQAGDIDLTSGALRAEDYVPARRAEEDGRLRLVELGVDPGADAFWFCLNPAVKAKDPRFAFVQRPEFRRAISHAVDRESFAESVFLVAAVPVWGPVTPGNIPWFWPDIPRYRLGKAQARALLREIGLEDRNGNGTVENAGGAEARFTVLTERGVQTYERGTAVLRGELAQVGIALDVVPLERDELLQRLNACDYDAMYSRLPFAGLDPAAHLDFWLTSGAGHVWNIAQRAPATDWERRLDTLILEQAAEADPERRRQQFMLVQQIFAENLPVLYFASPRLYAAHSLRVRGVVPSVLPPPVLWNADSLSVIPR